MKTLFRTAASLACAASLVVLLAAQPLRAAATMYSADIQGRIQLTEAQRLDVARILEQSETEMLRILQEHGIDPQDDSPNALNLYRASGALNALGQRTRSLLKVILDADQLQQYDQITTEVEQRIRNAVSAPERPNMSEMR